VAVPHEVPLCGTKCGPGRSRTACLFIANEAFNQVNFGPLIQLPSKMLNVLIAIHLSQYYAYLLPRSTSSRRKGASTGLCSSKLDYSLTASIKKPRLYAGLHSSFDGKRQLHSTFPFVVKVICLVVSHERYIQIVENQFVICTLHLWAKMYFILPA
jgi:hypothetical protein